MAALASPSWVYFPQGHSIQLCPVLKWHLFMPEYKAEYTTETLVSLQHGQILKNMEHSGWAPYRHSLEQFLPTIAAL